MTHQQQERSLVEASSAPTKYPYRAVFIGTESLIAIGGAAGAVQLMTGTYVPPVSDLEPLGLSSWVLPGVWLFASVAVPSATAAWFAARRRPATPTVVLVASGLLLIEVTVQIPFIGPSVLQAIFGTAALVLGGLGLHARKSGWRSPA